MITKKQQHIINCGIDIIRISRIENLIKKFGDKFFRKVFGQAETNNAPKMKNRRYYEYFAGRFAVKEAFVKATGTGFTNGIKMNRIQTLNLESGQPFVKFPAEYSNGNASVSISADGDYAVAYVVITNEIQ